MNDLGSFSEVAFMLWLEDKTILSIKQEIPQILVDEKEVIFLVKKNNDDLGFEN